MSPSQDSPSESDQSETVSAIPEGGKSALEGSEDGNQAENVWERFYYSMEDDLEADSPTRNIRGGIKRTGCRLCYGTLWAAICSGAIMLISLVFDTPFTPSIGKWLTLTGTITLAFLAIIDTSWLPSPED